MRVAQSIRVAPRPSVAPGTDTRATAADATSSIVLRIQVQPGIEGGDTSAAAIAEQLQRQASDASSPLFAGTITRHTAALSLAAAPREVPVPIHPLPALLRDAAPLRARMPGSAAARAVGEASGCPCRDSSSRRPHKALLASHLTPSEPS